MINQEFDLEINDEIRLITDLIGPIDQRLPDVPKNKVKNPANKTRINMPWSRKNEIQNFIEPGVEFQGGPQRKSGYKLALWTWFSATIDAMVMLAVSCFFVVIFAWIMQTHFVDLARQIKSQLGLRPVFVGSFVLSFWIYLIFMRVFNSATVGEMTCSLRLGQPAERFDGLYIFKVLVRTTIILLTGIFPLPLLSLICGRDLAGDLVGLKIYSLK